MRTPFPFVRAALFCVLPLLVVGPIAAQHSRAGLAALKQLSLEQLTELEVSSVSRREEPWWTAPAAIDVVTSAEIRSSGVQTLPDALRLAAGVHVAQSSARTWAISVRGFNVISANKISVTLDGRSLFTPFFSGVQWNAQDTLLEDIDRIEVARGPVGSLWGAYAVNGFIQILSKPAWDTQGYLATASAGSELPVSFAFRYGGKVSNDMFYRAYVKYWQRDWTYNDAGRHPQTATDFFQTGFRADAFRGSDTTLTLQGDVYTNKGLRLDRVQTELSGGNVLGRVRRLLPNDAEFTVEAYAEQTEQYIPISFSEQRRTGSLSAQYQMRRGAHALLVGLDALVSRDAIAGSGVVGLDPARRTFHNAGLFAHDQIQLAPHWQATVGAKVEHNVFSGFELSPTARLAWTPSPQTTVWGALSRAVRSPVRLDVDLYTRVGALSIFEANEDVKAENVNAVELGWRRRWGGHFTSDLTLFHNDYRSIRSFEPASAAAPLPITFRNSLTARSTGGELVLAYQPSEALLLKGNYRYLDLEFGRSAGSLDIGNAVSEGNDPKHLATVSVHALLPAAFEVSAYLRHASRLPNPAVDAYTTADLTVLWQPTEQWEFSVSGRDLLERQHRELITTNSLNEWVGRSVTLKATWRY
jgi:iron complex outermembrane receptor protein